MDKTNVMRLLEAAGIPYTPHPYDPALTDGCAVAGAVGSAPSQTFKTLVTRGASGKCYVFLIPVNAGLDLKKAARAVGEKRVAMLPQKELLPITGYVHGGCSPIGMKKPLQTVFHQEAAAFATILFSAGRRGFQVEAAPQAIAHYVGASFAWVVE